MSRFAFKFWHKKTNQIYPVHVMGFESERIWFEFSGSEWDEDQTVSGWSDKDDLMQWTGLTDKNGVKIFEGDVVEVFTDGSGRKGYVVFEDGTFCLASLTQYKDRPYTEMVRMWSDGTHDWYSLEQIEQDNFEVIGNIYENPELLEEK